MRRVCRSTSNPRWLTLVFALLATLAIPATPAMAQGNGEPESSEAFVLSTVRWEDPVVNVCWENPQSATAEERGQVIQAAQQWSSVANIAFVGWQQCSPGHPGIHILWQDSGALVWGLGNRLDGLDSGMVLNNTFLNWCESCREDPLGSIFAIAVHEFGHALGLAHEQNRDDTPPPPYCTQDPQGTDGDTKIGPWDIDSVMNYCNPRLNGDGILSETDKQAALFLYPYVSGTLDVAVSGTSTVLSWTLPNNPGVNGAWIVMDSNPGVWVRQDSTTKSFSNLAAGKHKVKVWATRAGVRDPILIGVETFTIGSGDPARLDVVVDGSTAALSWTLPQDPHVNGAWIVMDSNPGVWVRQDSTTKSFSNLAAGKHKVKVWATRTGGRGPILTEVEKFTIAGNDLGGSVRMVSMTATSVTVEWEFPPDPAFTGAEIWVNGQWHAGWFSRSNSSAVVANLAPGTSYEISIRGTRSSGSAEIARLSVTTPT